MGTWGIASAEHPVGHLGAQELLQVWPIKKPLDQLLELMSSSGHRWPAWGWRREEPAKQHVEPSECRVVFNKKKCPQKRVVQMARQHVGCGRDAHDS